MHNFIMWYLYPYYLKENAIKLYMIGNAHLDPAWMWRWGEGMEAFIATCRSALDRMNETAEFIFTCSSAAHYQWIEELEPEMFEEIRERVREGRWEIVGGWWVQADCNLPSGEGFVRQALLGQDYFFRKFGRITSIGYSPDAFGHNGGLPQLLVGSGLHRYIFCRPDPTELKLPQPLFRWLSPDGSSVLGYRVPFHYNMYQTTVPKKVSDIEEAYNGSSNLVENGNALRDFASGWALFYGVGNHGGGPTKEHIRDIQHIESRCDRPRILFSRLNEFFVDVEDEEREGKRTISEHADDLQLNAPGCYSVHSTIKRLNRKAEFQLLQAERYSSIATILTEAPYPEEALAKGWTNVCFNHFHDILCGVAITEALDDAIHLYGEALSIADRATQFALRRIARKIDTNGSGQTLIVFNPHTFDLDDYVTFELWHDIDKDLWYKPIDIRVTDDHGNEMVVQEVYPSGKIGSDRVGLTFKASAPGLGWNCYRVYYGEKSSHSADQKNVQADQTVLENDFLRLEFCPDRGLITSLLHKESGIEFVDEAAAFFTVISDHTDTWGHGVDKFNNVVGTSSDATIKLVEHGPTHATLRIQTHWYGSTIQQEFTLFKDKAEVNVRVRINWTEPKTMVKLEFPTNIESPRAIVEAAYSFTEKPTDGIERPCGSWKAVTGTIDGKEATLGIADTLVHGYSADGSTLSLSLFRSASYATHEPHVIDAREDVHYIDLGEIAFSYTLLPYVGRDFLSVLSQRAQILNMPPTLLLESSHSPVGSKLARQYRGALVSSPSVDIRILKLHRDRERWVVRLYNTTKESETVEVRLTLTDSSWERTYNGSEVKTYAVNSKEIVELNLIEQTLSENNT